MLPIDKYIGKLLVAGFIAPMMLFASTSPAMAYTKNGSKYFKASRPDSYPYNTPYNLLNKSQISPGDDESLMRNLNNDGTVARSGDFYIAVADDYTPSRANTYKTNAVRSSVVHVRLDNPQRHIFVHRYENKTKRVKVGKHKNGTPKYKTIHYTVDNGKMEWVDAFMRTYTSPNGRVSEAVDSNHYLDNTQTDDEKTKAVEAGYKNLKGIRWRVTAEVYGSNPHNIQVSVSHITFGRNAKAENGVGNLYDKINLPFSFNQSSGYRLMGQETSSARRQNLSTHDWETPISCGFSVDPNPKNASSVSANWLSVSSDSGCTNYQSVANTASGGRRYAYVNMNARLCVMQWHTGTWMPTRGVTMRLVYRVASGEIVFNGNGGSRNNVSRISTGAKIRVKPDGSPEYYQLPGNAGSGWTRSGYDFQGWGNNPGENQYGTNDSIPYNVDAAEDPSQKNVYASWWAHRLHITYADSLIDQTKKSPYADQMRKPKNGGAVMATTELQYDGPGGEGYGKAFKEYTAASQSSYGYATTPLNFYQPGYDSLEQWEQTNGHESAEDPMRWEHTASYGYAQQLCSWLTGNYTDAFDLSKASHVTINMRAVFGHHPYQVTYDTNGGRMGSPSTNGTSYTQDVPFSESHIVGTYNKNMSKFPPVSRYDYTQRKSWSLYVNTPNLPDYTPYGGQNFAPGTYYQGRWKQDSSVGMRGQRKGDNNWYDGWWWVNSGTFKVDWNKNPVVYQKDPSLWVGDPDGTDIKPFIYSYSDAQKAPDRPEANKYIGKIILQKGDKVDLLQFVQGSDHEDGNVTANDYVESISGYSGQTDGSTITKLDPAKCADGDGNFSVTYRTKDNDEKNDIYGVTATSTKSITLNFHINTAPVLTSGSDRYYFSSSTITIEDLKKRLTATDEKEDTNSTTAITYPKTEIVITAIRYPNGSLVPNPTQIDNTQIGDCLVWARITDTMHRPTEISFPMTITPDYEDVPDQKRIRFISQDFLDTLDEHVDGAAELKEELNKGFENYKDRRSVDSQSIDMMKTIKISELKSKGALNDYQYNRILNSLMKNSTKKYTADTAISYKTYVDLTDASYGEKYQYLWKN